jgi:hypothetical protein
MAEIGIAGVSVVPMQLPCRGVRDERDLVLATAEGYEWEDVRPFVDSLRATGFDGDVYLFASRMGEETRLRLAAAGVEVVRPRRLRLGDGAGRIARRLRWPPGFRHAVGAVATLAHNPQMAKARIAGPIASPEVARYFWYFNHLLQVGARYRNVMLTDVRDVVFLGPPFGFDVGDRAHFFLESEDVRLEDSAYNRSWLATAYGDDVLEQLGGRPISCSGVTIGSVRGVLEYLEVMIDQLARLPRHIPGIDQGVHNFVVHKELVPGGLLVPNREGSVLTVGKMSAREAASALVEREEEVRMVHQYDRHPELAWAADGVPSARAKAASVRRTLRERPALLSLGGVAAVALSAGLVEALTDRDWRLSGLEWPADFVTAVFLVLVVAGVVRAAQTLARLRAGVRPEPLPPSR